jgi:hypothetical protein
MPKRWIVLPLVLIILTVGTAFFLPSQSVSASNPPPGPDRFTVVTVDYTAFTWWMATWRKNVVVCSILTDHEGPPTPNEVFRDCGEKIYKNWFTQPPCLGDSRLCKGYYIFPVDQYQTQKEIPTELPEATVWLSLKDCEPVPSVSTGLRTHAQPARHRAGTARQPRHSRG